MEDAQFRRMGYPDRAMDATPHLLFGAALGMRMRNPLLAFAVGVASHACLDLLPHFNYTGWRPVSPARVVDVAVATGLSLLIARLSPSPLGTLAGATGGAFQDVERVLNGHAKDFFQRPPLSLQQHEIPPPWGLVTQAAVVAAALWLAWRGWQRSRHSVLT